MPSWFHPHSWDFCYMSEEGKRNMVVSSCVCVWSRVSVSSWEEGHHYQLIRALVHLISTHFPPFQTIYVQTKSCRRFLFSSAVRMSPWLIRLKCLPFIVTEVLRWILNNKHSLSLSLSVTELQLSRPARCRHLLLSRLLWSPWQPARALLQALPRQSPQQWGGWVGGDASVPDVAASHQHARVRRRGAGVHRWGRDQVRRHLLRALHAPVTKSIFSQVFSFWYTATKLLWNGVLPGLKAAVKMLLIKIFQFAWMWIRHISLRHIFTLFQWMSQILVDI